MRTKLFFSIFILLLFDMCAIFHLFSYHKEETIDFVSPKIYFLSLYMQQNLKEEPPKERVSILQEGKLTIKQTYDTEERIIEEAIFFDAKPIHSAVFMYDAENRIIENIDYNANAETLLAQKYLYRTDNSLWEIMQNNKLTLHQKNKVYRSEPGNQFLIEDIPNGLYTRSQLYQNDALAIDRQYIYDDGCLIERTVYDTNTLIQRLDYYNTDQLLVMSTLLEDSVFKQNTDFYYNGQRLIRRIIEYQDGSIIEEKLTYDANGSIAQVDSYQEDTLIKTTKYISKDNYTIQYYAFGKIRLTETYEKDILVEQKSVNEEEN